MNIFIGNAYLAIVLPNVLYAFLFCWVYLGELMRSTDIVIEGNTDIESIYKDIY